MQCIRDMGTKIKIITAGDDQYRDMIEGAMIMNARCGYDTLVYDIGRLGIGQPFDITSDLEIIASPSIMYTGPPKSKSTFKPKIILDALQHHVNDGTHFVWVDADAFCIQPIDDVFKSDFDIAVTMRRAMEDIPSIWPSIYNRYINAGVLFFKNTVETRIFINQWIRMIPLTTTITDQEALNRLLKPHVDFSKTGRVYDASGIRVLLLTTDEFNFYYFPESPHTTTRILHFKGDKAYSKKWFDMYVKPLPMVAN